MVVLMDGGVWGDSRTIRMAELKDLPQIDRLARLNRRERDAFGRARGPTTWPIGLERLMLSKMKRLFFRVHAVSDERVHM